MRIYADTVLNQVVVKRAADFTRTRLAVVVAKGEGPVLKRAGLRSGTVQSRITSSHNLQLFLIITTV